MNLLCDVGNSDLVLCDNLESGNEVKGRFKREEIYVYLWLIHVDVFVFFFLGCSPQGTGRSVFLSGDSWGEDFLRLMELSAHNTDCPC